MIYEYIYIYDICENEIRLHTGVERGVCLCSDLVTYDRGFVQI